MKDWKKTEYSDTFKKLVDNINENVDYSEEVEETLGTVLCNGVLYSGLETINGHYIAPLKSVDLEGIVSSDTILDNFILFFREDDSIIKLDQFPIDLLAYSDGRPHFLFIRKDLSYRVSNYMYEEAEEILLARFIIGENGTWNQFFVIGQRAGTPLYHAGSEWYEVDGLFVKSPGGLELSQTSGTVKRSGIDFTDTISPDLADFYGIETERLPIRYNDKDNEIEYNREPVFNIDPNHYMIYNLDIKDKVKADEYIIAIKNTIFGIDTLALGEAEELQNAIDSETTLEEQKDIINAYISRVDVIYSIVDKLYNLLGNDSLSSVRRAGLLDNKTSLYNLINDKLNTESLEVITEEQVKAITDTVCFIKEIDSSICGTPLDKELDDVQVELNEINFSSGEIKEVSKDKFTIQRVLWDVYENCYIIQYGNQMYDNVDEAIENSALLNFPAPYGTLFYIPLAILVVHQGSTSINEDNDNLILDRRDRYVDEEFSGYADLYARSLAKKALKGVADLEEYVNGELAEFIISINKRFTDFEAAMDGKFNNFKLDVNGQIDGINNKVTALNTRLDNFKVGDDFEVSETEVMLQTEWQYGEVAQNVTVNKPGWKALSLTGYSISKAWRQDQGYVGTSHFSIQLCYLNNYSSTSKSYGVNSCSYHIRVHANPNCGNIVQKCWVKTWVLWVRVK